MSLEASVHDIALDTAIGNESKAGLSFQPKALIGFLTGDTAAGWIDTTPIYMNEGVAVSASARAAYTAGMVDAAADGGNFRRGHQANRWMTAVKRLSNTEEAGVDLVSMDAGGYTYDIATAPDTNILALVAALGGSDITNAGVVTFEAPTVAAGTLDVTTVGFEPNLVILIANGRIATGYGGGGAFQISAFNSHGEQFAAWTHIITGGVPGDTSRGLRTDRAYYISTPSGGAVVSASFVSMLSNGFRLNFDVIADGQEITALCLAGTFRHKIVAYAKTTEAAPVEQDVDLGFAPKFALHVSAMKTSGSAGVDHNRLTIGMTDGTNERAYLWGEEDQASPTNVQGYIALDKFYLKADNATSTLDATADASFVGHNVRHAFDVNDGVATQSVIVGLGEDDAVVPVTVRSRPAMVF